MRLQDLKLFRSTSLATVKFVYLHSSIHTFFERVRRKIFLMLLDYIAAKACASPAWFTRPFLLVRGWGLGTRILLPSLIPKGRSLGMRLAYYCLCCICNKAQKSDEKQIRLWHLCHVNDDGGHEEDIVRERHLPSIIWVLHCEIRRQMPV